MARSAGFPLSKEVKNETKRRKLLVLRSQLEIERSTFQSHWKDLAYNSQQRRARFVTIDNNRGDRRNNNIINNTAIISHRTLRAGMMAGLTSPARPWFKLVPSDALLLKNYAVKKYLSETTDKMHDIFLKSNLYQNLPVVYGDCGQFATAAMLVEEDFQEVIRCFTYPIGTYMIACDKNGRVNTWARDFRMTVKQLVEKFGREDRDPDDPFDIAWENLSVTVKNYWDNNMREVWVDCVHMIIPNDFFGEDRADAGNKKYASVYFERGVYGSQFYDYTGPEDDRFLRISGYEYFPVLVPRWEVSAEDFYGTSCPGMDALGDVKGLQMLEKRVLQAVDKIVNPPMIAPVSMRNSKTSILPGDISYADVREGMTSFKPVYEPKLSIQEAQLKIQEHEKRIQAAYFTNLFLMFANDTNAQPDTATEVDEKKQEKMLALGPVLEQLEYDLHDPLVHICYLIGNRQRKFGPPPVELQGQNLNIEYLSIMAQAQKTSGLAGLERFISGVTNPQIVEQFPELKDKIDIDEYVEAYGDALSIPPQLLKDDKVVAQLRKQRQQQQQQQAQNENLQAKASAAKDLANAPTDGNNALSDLMNASKAGQIVPA